MGKPFLSIPGNFSMFPKHFTLVEHLVTPGEAHVNIFFSTEVPPPFIGGKKLPCAAQRFDRDTSENKSKQKDKTRTRRGGDVCIPLFGNVF